ncbi:hypothetical protein ASF00_15435 [Sphingomonas sp. Leaf34]|nr:hypothetical protein ASF00_15435 [Sphingomonas sp. Leaf34]
MELRTHVLQEACQSALSFPSFACQSAIASISASSLPGGQPATTAAVLPVMIGAKSAGMSAFACARFLEEDEVF